MIRSLMRVVAWPAIAAVVVSACGVNSLRVRSASEVSLTSSAVVTQASAALSAAKERRIKALTSLIASDPSCAPSNQLYIFVPALPPKTGDLTPTLCADGPNAKFPNYRAKLINFTPIGPDEIKPTLILIAALTEYGDAMGKIAGRPDPDISKILDSVAEKAAEAKALAEGLTKVTLPAIPDLSSKQAKTAKSLLQFIIKLSNEAQKVKDIRKLFADSGPETMQLLVELEGQISDWNAATTVAYGQINEDNLVRAYNAERRTLPFEGRRAFVELINQARQDTINIAKMNDAFLKAVSKLKEAHQTLDDLLNNRLTPEQREEANEISQARFFEALKLIADATIAWGVI
jgi:hypothetical protein